MDTFCLVIHRMLRSNLSLDGLATGDLMMNALQCTDMLVTGFAECMEVHWQRSAERAQRSAYAALVDDYNSLAADHRRGWALYAESQRQLASARNCAMKDWTYAITLMMALNDAGVPLPPR